MPPAGTLNRSADGVSELVEPLAEWASGSPGTEAAVELLIETEYWLERSEFVDRAVTQDEGGAAIDWEVAARLGHELVCSRGERFLLLLACALADPSLKISMGEIGAIDGRNLARVQAALRTARFGWT